MLVLLSEYCKTKEETEKSVEAIRLTKTSKEIRK